MKEEEISKISLSSSTNQLLKYNQKSGWSPLNSNDLPSVWEDQLKQEASKGTISIDQLTNQANHNKIILGIAGGALILLTCLLVGVLYYHKYKKKV